MGLTEVKARNFDQLVVRSERPVLVDFHAEWCEPCRAMKPVFEALSEEFSEDVVFAFVDSGKERALVDKFGISSYPTFIFVSGGKFLGKLQGYMQKSVFREEISKLLK